MIDVSDPTAPSIIGSLGTPDEAFGVAVAGAFAYVADRLSGLRSIAVDHPAFPAEIGFYAPNFVSTPAIAVEGDIAYAANQWVLDLIDVSNPEAPFSRGATGAAAFPIDIVVAGGFAYVSNYWSGGLKVFDVSDPDAPFQIGDFDPPFGVGRGVALERSRTYVVDFVSSNAHMTILDVSDPTAPTPLGDLTVLDEPFDIEVAGEIVYLGCENSLVIVDASDPAMPSEIGSLPVPAPGVAVAGELAYSADPLRVIDVSDPTNPVEVGGHPLPDSISLAIDVRDGLAFVGSSSTVLFAFDVSDPTAPFHLGSFDMPHPIHDLAIANGLVYVANDSSGLRIVDFGPEYLPEPRGAVMLACGIAMLGLLDRNRRFRTS